MVSERARAEAIPFSKLSSLPKTSINDGPKWRQGGPSNGQGPSIRVRIAKNLLAATIAGMDLSREIFLTKDKKQFAGSKKIQFKCGANTLAKKNKGPVLLASLNSASGILALDSQKFQGDMHVVADMTGKGCDIINETNMEQYISTLLGKEMNSSWPIEALKAQAVAARTYALFQIENQHIQKGLGKSNGAHDYYDLESSEKDQVSGGIDDRTAKTL